MNYEYSERETNQRTASAAYPDYTAELRVLRENGGVPDVKLVQRILQKHEPNAAYSRKLYERYTGAGVPIYDRKPRFDDGAALNNRVNHDFFGEIVDFKTGYFAGMPVGYSYAVTQDAKDTTDDAVDFGTVRADGDPVEAAQKALSDFVLRNNMHDRDMEVTKMAAACGYAGRLLYMDENGEIRVMILPAHETVLLFDVEMTEAEAGLRYYSVVEMDDRTVWRVEFYTQTDVYTYTGNSLAALAEALEDGGPHLFDGCPLQGVPNNAEMTGDAEKVLALIDAYDRAVSDANNELSAFANAYMLFENVNITDEDILRGQHTGAFRFFNGGTGEGRISFLTKDINDAFIEHHLDRLEANIYRFSKTPNLNDENFGGNASGVAMKYKLLGVESKCGMFQAKMQSAGVYMFRLLAGAWGKKGVAVDPLQCVMEFHRNFPQDALTEAQAVGALISAGLPERYAYARLSDVDDVEYIIQMKEEEAHDVPPVLDVDTVGDDGMDMREERDEDDLNPPDDSL